ncbi:hypothetical protein C8R45DRAFT_580774 [Mycena sanguinolenta]|nr:hypothetical protein C8R45DRAFT_580774 [Mycena sanguinolenta]
MIILDESDYPKQLASDQVPHIQFRICPHHCSQCEQANYEQPRSSSSERPMTWRRKLSYGAACISSSIFVLSVVQFYLASYRNRPTRIFQIFVALLTVATFSMLTILLHFGRIRGSRHTLARAISQIYVFCGLGLTWIGE